MRERAKVNWKWILPFYGSLRSLTIVMLDFIRHRRAVGSTSWKPEVVELKNEHIPRCLSLDLELAERLDKSPQRA